MNAIAAWSRLLRPGNLLLIALTPPALWASLVRPLPTEPVLTLGQIAAVGLAVALVAGAGNVVNDIADRTIDALNERPNPLNGGLPVALAWVTYLLFNLGAAGLTWQLAVDLDRLPYAALLPLAVIGLLAYAFALKCVAWVGNLVVAAFCAGVPAIVAVAEPAVLREAGSLLSQSLFAYTGFAFFGTWARELVKDLQDREGDRAAGCHSLAVRWPERRVQTLVGLALFGALAIAAWLATSWALAAEWAGALTWSALWALLAAIAWQVRSGDYAALSRNLKLAIVIGLAFLLLGGARGQV